MRRPLGKVVRREFAKRLAEVWPWFSPAREEELPGGYRLYSWRPGADLTLYVLLELHPTADWFTVSIAWSEKNRLPVNHGLLRDPPREGEKLFRLRQLIVQERMERWWELMPSPTTPEEIYEFVVNPIPIEEALPKVKPLVDDLIGHLTRLGGEHFRQIVTEHRYVWPGPELPLA